MERADAGRQGEGLHGPRPVTLETRILGARRYVAGKASLPFERPLGDVHR